MKWKGESNSMHVRLALGRERLDECLKRLEMLGGEGEEDVAEAPVEMLLSSDRRQKGSVSRKSSMHRGLRCM